ncbi:MAG: aldo/keto reductase, partial [Bacteroidota bacterium]|nr:aldo/keto reductase [Bacteroidota bacterium]
SKKYNCTPGQVVLNWLTAQSRVVVIPNTSKEKRAIENAKSTNFNLSPEDLKLIDENLKTPVSYVDVNEIKVSNDYNRKVYTTVQEALDNKMNLTPSPVQLAEEMKKGFFLKPIRLKQIQDNRYDLIEGRLRYWAWVIAFGNSKKIPALVWKK